jgi:hypothetical protein
MVSFPSVSSQILRFSGKKPKQACSLAAYKKRALPQVVRAPFLVFGKFTIRVLSFLFYPGTG